MRRIAPVTLLMAAVFAVQAAAQTPAPAAAPAGDDPVVARVDGAAIHRSEVMEIRDGLPPQFQQMPLNVLFPIVLDRLIEVKLLAAAARRDGLQNAPEIQRRLRQSEERVLHEEYLNRATQDAVSEQAVRERFARFQRDNPGREQIRARHILVREEQQARAIIAELAGGADFAEIARTRSIDPSGRQNGGDLDWFSDGEMVPEFWAAASQLREGEVSRDPARSQFGWHVIRVEGRRTQTANIQEAREQILTELQREATERVLVRLRQGAQIERFNMDGAPMPALQPLPSGPAAPARPIQPQR